MGAEEGTMDILGLVVLLVVIFLAFRVGAFLIQVLLGLLALALIVWLVSRLFGGTAPALAAMALVG
jgi:hypothetical protein